MDMSVGWFVCSPDMCSTVLPGFLMKQKWHNLSQVFSLPVIMIGVLVVGGLQVETETFINILSYPAGLTAAEFSVHIKSCIPNLLYTPSVDVMLDFSTILSPVWTVRMRSFLGSQCMWCYYSPGSLYSTVQCLMFDHAVECIQATLHWWRNSSVLL